MFNNKRRLASAWAKGLMLGKAVGARDERERIIELLEKERTGLNHEGTGLNHYTAVDIDWAIALVKGKCCVPLVPGLTKDCGCGFDEYRD